MMIAKKSISQACLLLLVACSGGTPKEVLAPPPDGLEAKPQWLTFTCVEPGCETTRVTSVKVVGTRNIAIKRIVLSDRDRDDFEFTIDEEPPFILEAGDTFDITSTYKPNGDPRLGDVELMVTYTDAAAGDSEDRVEPGELMIPLVRRLIGEPVLAVNPGRMDFGSVLPSARKVLPLTISNSGFGNVGVVIESVESDSPDFRVTNLPTQGILPDTTWDVDVTFTPREERFYEALITVRSADTSARPALVSAVGTSLSRPAIAVFPASGVDFGEVPVGTQGTATLEIFNQGSDVLELFRVNVTGGGGSNVTVELPRGAQTATVASLSSIIATLQLDAQTPGIIDARLGIRSNDRAQNNLEVPIVGLVTEPAIQVTPASIDFGGVPRGWVVSERIEVENVGFGDLMINNVAMVLGSSELFTIQNLPRLPVALGHQERLSFEVEYRSEAQATFNGNIGIESNDPDDSGFVEIPVTAVGTSCEEGCPIENGTPSCTGGVCAVGSCDNGFYDTDMSAATGCECAEINRDPGAFCADGHWAGTLDDTDGDRANYSGVLATDGDVDIITFFAKDSTNFFSDDYDVRVQLQTSDPTIEMCVYRHDTGSHENACFFENERCGRSFRRDGRIGPSDDADYIVKIFRRNGAAPTCSAYTVFMRNG